MNTAAESDFVQLRDGPTVPLAALRFLWELEARGCYVRQDRGLVVITPGRLVTDQDKATLRRYRSSLLALLNHTDGGVH